MRNYCLAGLSVALILVALGQSQGAVTLVAGGEAQAVIVVASSAPGVVHYGAAELQYHVKKASGVELEIVDEDNVPQRPSARVYLGDCEATREAGIDSGALPPEACAIRVQQNTAFVAGRDQEGDPLAQKVWAGTLFGVYELLEDNLGVHWLWPGELGEIIPHSTSIIIADTDRIVEPHFIQRWIRTTGEHHAGRPEEQVWLRRHRMGRSRLRLLYPCHAFRNWWNQYGEEHPEYFNLLPSGKREPVGLAHEVSMCVAEPRLWRQIVQNWLALPEERPGVRPLIDCSENDGIALCTCAKCRAWDAPNVEARSGQITGPEGKIVTVEYFSPLSDRYAKFWAAVQREARKFDPEATLITLAYSTYRKPPVAAKLNDHIIVGIVGGFSLPGTKADLSRSQRAWQGWADTGASLYLRPNEFLQGYCMPHIFAETFARYFRFTAEHGMIGTDFDSLTGMYGTQGPNLYLLARMHVRPFKEPDELLQEYYAGFGPAAGQVRAYFDYWAEISKEVGTRLPSWPYWPRGVHALYSPEDFVRGRRLLRVAKIACHGDPAARARVEFLEKGLKNARLSFEVSQAMAQDPEARPGGEPAEALARLARFRKTIEREYVANLGFLRWSESVCGWDWAAGGLSD